MYFGNFRVWNLIKMVSYINVKPNERVANCIRSLLLCFTGVSLSLIDVIECTNCSHKHVLSSRRIDLRYFLN